jgi:hypothetical protein
MNLQTIKDKGDIKLIFAVRSIKSLSRTIGKIADTPAGLPSPADHSCGYGKKTSPLPEPERVAPYQRFV